MSDLELDLDPAADPPESSDDDTPADPAAQARRIAGYLIVAGVAIAVGCLAFIVWEQWRANQAALASAFDPYAATVEGFPVAANGKAGPAPSDPVAPDSPSDPAGPLGADLEN